MENEDLPVKEIISKAGEAEAGKDHTLAIGLYNTALKKDGLNIHSYDRLMKIHRQLKEYKKELAIINKGLRAYEQFYKSASKKRSKKISEISQKLNRSFGLTDKKGNSIYDPEPIARWKKRKIVVEKKIS